MMPSLETEVFAWPATGVFNPNLNLTPKARLVYAVLRRWRGKVLSWTEIAHWVWDDEESEPVFVRTILASYVKQLRAAGVSVKTHPGFGYQLIGENWQQN